MAKNTEQIKQSRTGKAVLGAASPTVITGLRCKTQLTISLWVLLLTQVEQRDAKTTPKVRSHQSDRHRS
jgi:hypothetical protein